MSIVHKKVEGEGNAQNNESPLSSRHLYGTYN